MRTSSRRVIAAAATGVAALALSGPASSYLCHKDPPGTLVLFIHGKVAHYSASGTGVTIAMRSARGCRTALWDVRTRSVTTTEVGCRQEPKQPTLARTRVSVERGDAVRPPALVVRGSHVRRWPLPARPTTLAAVGNLAVFSAAGDGALYAIRLTDGAAGLIGPNRRGDVPRLTTAGVFYLDDEFKRDRVRGVVRLKFVPTRGIESIIDKAQLPLVTNGRISALSMDGPRVAVAVGDPDRRCDRVLYWNVAWRPAQRISAPDGPTCSARAYTAISRVAISGFRAAWVRSYGSEQAVVAGSPKCQEWVIKRLHAGAGGDTVSALAGDGQTLAFAIARHERELRGMAEIDVISGRFRAVDIASGRGTPEQVATDGRHVAVLWDDGKLELIGVRGRHLRTLHVGHARAIALAGHAVVVLRTGRVDVYPIDETRRSSTRHVPRNVSGLDVEYGIALLRSNHVLYALDLATGRSRVIGRAPAGIVDAQIEKTGVAYAYNDAAHGVARFVPIAAVERALSPAA